jgi:hypothetical protein
VDPLAEEMRSYSVYNYGLNNPMRYTDPDGNAPVDIILLGANKSSVTVKTELIDIKINASSLGVDFGGNYTLSGKDILQAVVDIGGVLDPTPTLDLIGASLSAESGDYWGAAASVLGAAIPYAGDFAKTPKIVKGLDKISDGIKAVNGNSKASTKAQHVYEVFEKGSGNVVKTGISGGKVSKADKSYRATSQVNKMNKAEGAGKYDSRIVEKIPAGKGARQKALDAEKVNADKHRRTLDPEKHKRP